MVTDAGGIEDQSDEESGKITTVFNKKKTFYEYCS
jgi:hypothetical protein